MTRVTTIEQLEALYDRPVAAATVKESAVVTPEYRALIEASPFCVLATAGPEGLDASPRGDKPGFVRIHDERTLMMPDRRGNNRLDSLRNIVRDPRMALLFLLPGHGTTLRVNGEGTVETDTALRESFAVEAQSPRSVIVLEVKAIYFQCARAIVRSDIWNPETYVDAAQLPSPGQILKTMSQGSEGGDAYDKAWPDRAKKTLW